MFAFEAKSASFLSTYFMNYVTNLATKLSHVTRWKAFKSAGVNSDYVSVALQLLSAPALSASIERIFSNFSHIHTKIKNRLGNLKTSKLVFCYRMLHGDCVLDY